MSNVDLVNYLEEFSLKMAERLDEKAKKYGDTWRIRGLVWNGEPQEQRFLDWLYEKYDAWFYADEPFPWVDIANEALIGYIRENKDNWMMPDG